MAEKMESQIWREFAFCAGLQEENSVMEARRWETREDIEEEARAKGFIPPSLDHLERWRGKHLLKRAKQIWGNIVELPPGTAKQAVRLMELLRVKEKFDYVGWELWWEGFDVGDEWWMPTLRDAAEKGDVGLKQMRKLLARWNVGGSDADEETEFDRLERETPANALGWQIARRLKIGETATYLRILSEVASGKLSGFDEGAERGDGSDYDVAIRALDLARAGNYPADTTEDATKVDRIFGRDLNLISALRYVLRDIGVALRAHLLSDVLTFPVEEINAARDDVGRALEIGTTLYEMGRWVFGPGAFGLRIMPWLAQRPARQRALWILGFAVLRRGKHPLLSSTQIAILSEQAAKAKSDLTRLRQLAQENPKFARVITPSALRRAFRSFDEFERFKKRLAAVSLEASAAAADTKS
jgi:hypothetical protein